MCGESHLGNRAHYTAFIGMIASFMLHLPQESADNLILAALDCNLVPTGLTIYHEPFNIGFKVRNTDPLNK